MTTSQQCWLLSVGRKADSAATDFAMGLINKNFGISRRALAPGFFDSLEIGRKRCGGCVLRAMSPS